MDDIKDTDRISYLLVKKRIGDITSAEELELKRWSERSSRYGDLLRDWETDGYLRKDYELFTAADVNAALEKGKIMIEGNKGKHKFPLRRLLIAASTAAAVVLLFTGIRLFLDMAGDVPVITHLTEDMPVLILEDGREIVLEGNRSTSRDGVVTVETAHGETRALELADITYTTLVVPKGHTYELTLDDGTRVWLNAASRLRYPLTFGPGSRELELSGEAFFDVKKDTSRPFRVVTDGEVIEVLGTKFNVQAYEDEEDSYTTLIDGMVRVSAPAGELTLSPGQQAVNSGNSLTARKVDTDMISHWRYGMFVLENKPLEHIMTDLSRWYDFEVKYEDESIRNIVFYGMAPQYEEFYRVMELLRKTGEIDFRIKNRTIYVRSKK